MFRALGVLRFVVLLNAVGLGWDRRDSLDHPGPGLGGARRAWPSGRPSSVWAYPPRAGAALRLLVADLLVARGAIAASPYVKGDGLNATLPGFWVMGAVLAWAIVWRLARRAGGRGGGVGRRPRASGTSSPRRTTATSSC